MANPRVQETSGWVKGVSGNPRGRPKGSKNKFSKIREDWLAAYHKGGGVKFWKELAKVDLATYMKLGVSMLPKDFNVDVDGKIEVSWLGEDSHTLQTP
jgi:hypothetical protein